MHKVTNEEVFGRVNEDSQVLNYLWQRKHRWIGHVLIYRGFLCEIIEGRMRSKPTRGRKKIEIPHDLANVALK